MRIRIMATICCALLLAAPAGAQEEEREEPTPAVEPPSIGWLPSLVSAYE